MGTRHLGGLLATRTALLLTLALLGAGAVGWPGAWGLGEAPRQAAPVSLAADVGEAAKLRQEIVAAHNRYRAAAQVPPLTWSPTLARHAQAWANTLASRGGLVQHSSQTAEGENVWVGTAGAFTYTQMVEAWGKEQQFFVPGIFPTVSTTGNWADVGHYTQMIWRQTREVGAAIAHGGGNTVLVCRYSPHGNIVGKPIF
jgi:Cysteine-rich secretory protein family